MRDLEIVLCHRHSCFQPRYPHFKLCPECHEDASREAIIVEAVVNYFSRPKFREFFIQTEREIQMGIDRRRADIVLLDRIESFLIIAECKRKGVVNYGYDQLESYLCATDTQFGVFANSTDHDDWKFYENLRRNRFTKITRDQFEERVVKACKAKSIREELTQEIAGLQENRDKLENEIEKNSRKRKNLKDQTRKLEEEKRTGQFDCEQLRKENENIRNHVNSLETQRSNLETEIDQCKQQKHEVQITRDQLNDEVDKLQDQRNNLKIEIRNKKQEQKELRIEIERLRPDQNNLQTQNQILSDQRDQLQARKDELQAEIERLEMDIAQKTVTILSPGQVPSVVLYRQNDIHITATISSRDATCGCELQIKVAGQSLRIYVPSGTRHQQVLCLKNQGQFTENGSVGDLYITISIKGRFRNLFGPRQTKKEK